MIEQYYCPKCNSPVSYNFTYCPNCRITLDINEGFLDPEGLTEGEDILEIELIAF